MKFALLSVTYAGLFYSGKALTIEQQIHKAKSLGFEALAIETKRPIASPIDISKKEREKIAKLGYTFVRKYYSWDAQVKKMLEILNRSIEIAAAVFLRNKCSSRR